jgi:DNA-3-methyladenine glycosylase
MTIAAGIRLADNGADLLSGPFSLEPPTTQVVANSGPRTGVSGAGGSIDYSWRFWISGDPTVSPYKRHPRAHA